MDTSPKPPQEITQERQAFERCRTRARVLKSRLTKYQLTRFWHIVPVGSTEQDLAAIERMLILLDEHGDFWKALAIFRGA